MTKRKSCGETMVELLEEYGCEYVFGIPGTHAIELYRGLGSSRLKHILARHEQGAGFMADGYARISGKPGLCFLITGPGLTNAVTSIAQAYSDSVPMLVITPVNERESLGKSWGRLHETSDQKSITAPITNFSARVMKEQDFPDTLAKAFDSFDSGRPLPVHMEIPLDLLGEQARLKKWHKSTGAEKNKASNQQINDVAGLLKTARNPVIIVGGGAIRAASAVRELAEHLSIPVVTSTAGKGVLPESHELSLGATFSIGATQDFVLSADVILAIGTELADTDFWRNDFRFPGRLVRVDLDPVKLNNLHDPEIAICGDSKDFAERLCVEVKSQKLTGNDKKLTVTKVRALKAEFVGCLSEKELEHLAILKAIRKVLPEDGIVVADMTQIAYTANRFLDMELPGQYLHPSGYGTLGYALPAGIGAKIAAPDRAVVILVGDSGILYTLQEMATAAELELNIVLILWNNGGLGQIKDDMIDAGYPPMAVEPKNPDYVALAQSFGWSAETLGHISELEDIFAAALTRVGPSLIEIKGTVQ